MNQRNKKTNIEGEWGKAQTALREAEVLIQNNLAEGALSRLYYAALHAAKSMILTQGLEASSHKGVGRLFSLHFVKTGLVDVKYSRILSRSQQDREEADYFSEYVFDIKDAHERMAETKDFLETIETFLKKNGWR